ncbi:MAG TPA: peroxiredoxin [Thermoplasmata archaeon]|nr:peroxiredoxin [Thermoplasmata archaeon]
MIEKGQTAPDFEAPDQDGKPFRLSSLKGSPVVLYFYPKADTPGCTIEAKGFRDAVPEFRAHHVAIVGVSADDCPAQKAFHGKYGLNFPLVADSAKKVGALYGVLHPGGHERRVSFLIGADGKVVDVVDGAPPDAHVARARATFLGK